MRKINHVPFSLAFTLALLASAPAAFGQEPRAGRDLARAGAAPVSVAGEILRLEREYEEATKRGDAEAVGRMHAEDFRMTARGRVTEGAELMARLRDKSRPCDVIESLTTEDVRVRDYGQTVVNPQAERVQFDPTVAFRPLRFSSPLYTLCIADTW